MRPDYRSPDRNPDLLLVIGLSLGLGGGCAPEEEYVNPLPQKPQIQVSSGFVVFDVVASGGSARRDVVFLNGGQDDLVFTDISLADNEGAFRIEQISPADMIASSQGAVNVTVSFGPNIRGVSQARLVTASNAENLPALELELVGPAGSRPLADGPDLLLFETTARVIEDVGQAFVRFVNVGERSLAIGGYTIVQSGEQFSFPQSTATPTVDDAIPLGPGDWIIVSVNYDGTSTGDDTATFTITSYDYRDVTYEGTQRVVPPNALVDTDVILTAIED